MGEDGLVGMKVRVSQEVHAQMARLIPWGMRRNVIETVLQLVLDAVERDGMVVAGAILDGRFKLVRSELLEQAQISGGRKRDGSTRSAS